MRILHVTDFYPPVRGGLENYVDSLVHELCDRGHDVHVATLTTSPQPSHPQTQAHTVRTLASSVIRHADPDRPFHPPLPDPAARRGLAALIEQVHPDVVHVHNWLGVSLPRTSVPVVLTAHDYALLCQRRTLMRADGSACTGPSAIGCLRCGADGYGAIKSALVGGGTVVGRRKMAADIVLTLSAHVARTVSPYVGAPVRVIPGFVPRPGHRAARPAVDGRYLMYAGDPGPHKGLDRLLDMWREWRPRELQLLVATTKPIGSPLPDGVVARRMDRAGVIDALADAVALVVPSMWDEPFGMVAIEAMSQATPVVAHAVGALPEIVQDGHNGLLVPAGDAARLADAIRRIVDDRALAQVLSTGARRSAAAFSADAVVPQIESVYAELIAARSAA